MRFLKSPIAVSQLIESVGFEEVFSPRMYDAGLPQRVRRSEFLQVLFRTYELDAPRGNLRVRTLWGGISHCSIRLLLTAASQATKS